MKDNMRLKGLRRMFWAGVVASSLVGLGGCGGDAPEVATNTNAPTNNARSPQKAPTNPQNATPRRAFNFKFINSLPPNFATPEASDEVGQRIMADYGAVYVARGGVTPPPVVLFRDAAACARWQAGLDAAEANINGTSVVLQKPALTALQAARAEANQAQLSITPRGADASRRDYETTVTLWQSRVEPALAHWVGNGRLTPAEAARIRALSPADQVPEVLKLEAQGIYFSKDFAKSILYSVAAPGTSQHLSLLALDVTEFANPRVRSILAAHGWFQTVKSDMPHFTYLGVKESELPNLGLTETTVDGQKFWIPAN